MRILVLQHVEFEGPGRIGAWAAAHGASLRMVRPDLGQELPGHHEYDGLVVLGGPMGVNDKFPWLKLEMSYLAKAMALGRPTLGICLGAQLMAAALGAPVARNPGPEIGWHELALSPQARSMHLFRDFPARFTAFHWHGDTFGIPRHGIALASSAGCQRQGFMLGEHILGLQFHLETDAAGLSALLANCQDELHTALAQGRPFVQDEQAILAQSAELMAPSHALCDRLLSRFFG